MLYRVLHLLLKDRPSHNRLSPMTTELSFDKDRSIKACIADGWRITANHWWGWLKNLWPVLLVLSTMYALWIEIFTQWLGRHALPALRLSQSGASPEIVRYVLSNDTLWLVYLFIATLGVVILTALYAGRTGLLINKLQGNNDIQAVIRPYITKQERRKGWRLLAVDAFYVLCFILIFAGIFILSNKVGKYWILWIALLPAVWLYSAAKISRVGGMCHSLTFSKAVILGLRRSLGQPFIVLLLSGIPRLLAGCPMLLIPCIYVLSNLTGYDSLLRGDEAILPRWLPLLFMIFNLLALACWKFLGLHATLAIALCLHESSPTVNVRTEAVDAHPTLATNDPTPKAPVIAD